MVLKIKNKSDKDEDIIELERLDGGFVIVRINGENIATLYDDGEFVFHGQGTNKYRGNWKK